MMAYKVIVDENECIGCGACEAQCPEGFVMDNETMKAKPKKNKVEDDSCIKEAVDICPVDAIKVEKDE